MSTDAREATGSPVLHPACTGSRTAFSGFWGCQRLSAEDARTAVWVRSLRNQPSSSSLLSSFLHDWFYLYCIIIIDLV